MSREKETLPERAVRVGEAPSRKSVRVQRARISAHGEQCRESRVHFIHFINSVKFTLQLARGVGKLQQKLPCTISASLQLLQPSLYQHLDRALSAPLRGNLGLPGLSFLPVTHREQKVWLLCSLLPFL